MNKRSTNRILIIMLFFLAVTFPPHAQNHQKIVETVNVGNIEIAVRVFDGNKPVKGLKKEDFQLYLNGKKKTINGFYQETKKLEKLGSTAVTGMEAQPGKEPRIFVLIFNLSDYHEDLTGQMDILFNRIIRRGDRLIVITNRFFFPEWLVTGRQKMKRKILGILRKEVGKMKFEILRLQSELNAAASITKSRLTTDIPNQFKDPEIILREFFLTYQFALEDIKRQYLNIPLGQYIKVAEYLRCRQAQKYVLNFYQLGRLPMLKEDSVIADFVRRIKADFKFHPRPNSENDTRFGKANDLAQKIHVLYTDFILKIQATDDYLVNDISKSFLNSGAVFHTLLMKPVQPGFSDDFEYKTISTESEHILKKISHLTGGKVLISNKLDTFIDKITVQDDVVYVMTYGAGKKRKKKPPKLRLKLANKQYRVVYDDQMRKKEFNKMMKRMLSGTPDLEIASVDYIPVKNRLAVRLRNIQLVDDENDTFGAVRARIKIQTKKKKIVAGYEKTFKGIDEKGLIYMDVPKLAPGNYTVILEIRDLFSLKNVFIGDAVNIKIK